MGVWDRVPIEGTWKTSGGALRAGQYIARISTRLASVSDDSVFPAGVFARGTFTVSGSAGPSLSLSVPASDDSAVTPQGFTIDVEVLPQNGTVELYRFTPTLAASASGIDLSDVTPLTGLSITQASETAAELASSTATAQAAVATAAASAAAAYVTATVGGTRAVLRYDPATKSNGLLAASLTADTGQPMTSFMHGLPGANGFAVAGGVLMHTPYAGANSGCYLQANLGGRVRRVGAMVSWPLNAVGKVVIVIPSTGWNIASAGDIEPPAGFHLSVSGNGVWTLLRFNNSGGTVTLADQTTHGRFLTTTWGTGYWPLDVWIDPDNSKAVITWPDGTSSTIVSSYFNTETGNYAIWELFESNGVTDVPGTFGALWADTAATTPDVSALTSYRTPGRNAPAVRSVSGAVSLDLSQASVHILTLTGNITSVAQTGALSAGQEIEIQFVQDGTGSRTLAGVTSTIKWVGGSAPTLTTTANRRDIFRFRMYAAAWYEISRSMNVG
jgi:hypothetical protein